MNIPLTISENYCAGWGLFEAIREFMQNGRDETRRGSTFDAWYLPEKKMVRMATKGSILKRKTLLMGSGDKSGRSDMLGNHGEGYKIGSLVLLREGKGVKIRTGEEVWMPSIVYSKEYESNVISFNITGGNRQLNQVIVEITGVALDEWKDIGWKFLFMDEHKFNVVESPSGDVLVDGDGYLYVDGIWVYHDQDLIHGYNFLPQAVELDRDRRIIESFESRTAASRIWESLYMKKSEEYGDSVDHMLASECPDVAHFQYDWCVSEKVRDQISTRFIKKHGEKAIPVATTSESRELEFFGRKGEVVKSDVLRNIVEKRIGTLHTVKMEAAKEIQGEYSTIELSPDEAKNLLIARDVVAKGISENLRTIEIVDFRDPGIMGMRKDGRVFVAKKTLSDPIETIKTVVEEIAHVAGADGTHSHVEKIHDIYARALVSILTQGQ